MLSACVSVVTAVTIELSRLPWLSGLCGHCRRRHRCLLSRSIKPGRPPVRPRRQLIDGIRRRTRTGVPWRNVSEPYGPWGRVYVASLVELLVDGRWAPAAAAAPAPVAEPVGPYRDGCRYRAVWARPGSLGSCGPCRRRARCPGYARERPPDGRSRRNP
ncbi:transposase [Streptomyces sp. NPDC003077]|uniref:transposase n=1 Tax=Streptomyces sp. NPDC003077 TaxID=3154443 RepID=UPI0033A460BD